MKCQEVIDLLNRLSPPEYAMSWDNPGLLVGSREKEIRTIFVTLDVDEKTVQEAVDREVDLIVSHHPMIFHPISSVTDDSATGRKILKLARADISVFAMHTNFDVMGGMSALAADRIGLEEGEVLEVTAEKNGIPEGIGRIGRMPGIHTVSEAAGKVCEAFGLKHVTIYGDPSRIVSRTAISPGSGRDMVGKALKKSADLLITGDIGHHEGLDAVEGGMAVIDATHAGIERIFIRFVADYLEEQIPEGVRVIRKNLEETVPGKIFSV